MAIVGFTEYFSRPESIITIYDRYEIVVFVIVAQYTTFELY